MSGEDGPAAGPGAAAAAARERRREQLRQWGARAGAEPGPGERRARTVRFERAAEFLAACAGGDLDEARLMLCAADPGPGAELDPAAPPPARAVLDSTNADGISALHQFWTPKGRMRNAGPCKSLAAVPRGEEASVNRSVTAWGPDTQACIDENLEVVRFLVEQGATVNQADNEGWTPLHVAASCGYLDIARYLLSHGANIAAVNSDGDLPLDLAESDPMEGLLKAEIARRGWQDKVEGLDDEEKQRSAFRQPRRVPGSGTGDSFEDGSAEEFAKGRNEGPLPRATNSAEARRLLLQAGYDPELRDGDGWTPLHAAAHWGVEDACRLLAEHGGGMDSLTHAGQRPCDLADEEVLSLLEELARKQEDVSVRAEGLVPDSPCPLNSLEEGAEGVSHPDFWQKRESAGKAPESEKLAQSLDPSRRPRVPGVENSDSPAQREAPDGQGPGPQAAREPRKVGKEWRGPAEGEEAEPADRSPESSTLEGGPSARRQRSQRDLHPEPEPESEEQDGGFRKLYAELRRENERLREALTETTLRLAQLKVELERATQRQERFAERPALLELERFERRALERKAAELEEELKALSDLRADNQRLKDENAALIRVISKLSK
ncbi:protein phosphatase 1 regulatory subunit 12C [Papio anubis]|uniref:protein phosphatase 1 regulatory subunit 12C n=1 Tax=Papio anubis TaxID=9555 RepID=UPI0012AEA9EB|nr:protein phosphatase 1 regulatory subunit 12C [Papio anubis]